MHDFFCDKLTDLEAYENVKDNDFYCSKILKKCEIEVKSKEDELQKYKQQKEKFEECKQKLEKCKQKLKKCKQNFLISKSLDKSKSIDIDQIKKISNIFRNRTGFEKYIKDICPYGFIIHDNFKLGGPYFSREEDEFYAVQNPVLKEKISKFPMIRPTGWKGMLSSAALVKIKADIETFDIEEFLKDYKSFLRIFGSGSEEIRSLQSAISSSTDEKKLSSELFRYAVLELGINLEIKKENSCTMLQNIINKVTQNKEDVLEVLTPRRGRALFYPTYFDKIGFEVINPHDRGTRAGTKPIFYEVVPKEAEGIFQLAYIPYDGIFKDEATRKKEIEEDEKFMNLIYKILLENIGIGAKTKLGWGRKGGDKQ